MRLRVVCFYSFLFYSIQSKVDMIMILRLTTCSNRLC